MQWFVEYLATLSFWERPWEWGGDSIFAYFAGRPTVTGMPGDDIMGGMTEAAQPDLAGRGLYDLDVGRAGSSSGDRELGTSVTNPQTAQERTDYDRRVAGSGVRGSGGRSRDERYQTYLRLLNNAFIQGASGAVHDHFNARGLQVENDEGTRFRVGGDETLLAESDRVGAQLASEASHLSQRAILEILQDGSTDVMTEAIFAKLPRKVVVEDAGGGEAGAVPLEQWQDEVLRQLCFDEIFPEYEDSGKAFALRCAPPRRSSSRGASRRMRGGPHRRRLWGTWVTSRFHRSSPAWPDATRPAGVLRR